MLSRSTLACVYTAPVFRHARLFGFALLLSSFLFPCALLAQRSSGGRTSGGIIEVVLRNPDGTPAPSDIHIRLESAEGGAEGDAVTVRGKCQFTPNHSGVFVVRLREHDYKEVDERVELTYSNHAYVTLELKRLAPEKPPTDPPAASTSSVPGAVSVGDLGVPLAARQEYEKGEIALHDKQPGDAIKHLEKATKLYANYPQAFRMLGEAYLQQQDYPNAEASLKKSIELQPDLAASYADLGAVRNQSKNYPGAEEALKKCLELSPDASAAKFELAKTYWATNRWQDAAPLAEAAVKDLPDLASAHVLLANIRLKQRNGPAALHEYQEYLRLDPNGSMAPQVREMAAKLQAALPPQ